MKVHQQSNPNIDASRTILILMKVLADFRISFKKCLFNVNITISVIALYV